MTREEAAKRDKRLSKTREGAALLSLLDRYPSQAALNLDLGIRPNIISQCIMRGRISRPLARLIEKKLGIPKEQLRPDLSADQWEMGDPGKKPGKKVRRDGQDQQTLLMLTDHFGSVRNFAEKAGITVADYHRWMSRNKIAEHALPVLKKLRTTPEIKARLSAAA